MSSLVNRKGEPAVEVAILGSNPAIRATDNTWKTSYPWETTVRVETWLNDHVREGVVVQDIITKNEAGIKYLGLRFCFGCRKEAIHFKLVWV